MKRVISLLTMVAMMFSLLLVLPQKIIYAANPIEVAVTWAIDIANDSSHGYSQNNRWGPDYDCSSFVMSAYIQAGIPLNRSNSTTRENSAYWMVPEYEKNNFTYIPWSSIGNQNSLIRGDILWRNGHTELYIGDGKNVGAHQDEYGGIEGANKGDQTGNEISITNFDNSGSWTGVLRYNGVVPPVICNCTDNYAGIYTTKNVNTTLNIRSGHGSGYSVIGSIPAGADVKVTKSDGAWAHVEYNGVSGFASMDYLTKKSLPSVYMKISGETVPPDNQPYGKFFGIYGTITAYPDIEAVWGGIRKQGQTEYVQYVQDFPYASSYDLHGIFNDQLIFNALAEDYYTYVIYGRDTDKREYKLIEKKFKVGNPQCISHTYGEWTIKTAVTCTSDGIRTRKCSICGYSENETINKTGHSYIESNVAATCTSDGKKEEKCKICGDTQTTIIKAEGHKFGEWEDCITDGTQERTCYICNYTETKNVEVVTEPINMIYDANGGTCRADAKKVYYGERVGSLILPNKENSEFLGWFTENGECITEDTIVQSKTDFTVYAKWKENELLYGDITNDDILNIQDAVILEKYFHGVCELTVSQYNAADINSDGLVNILDMVLLKNILILN